MDMFKLLAKSTNLQKSASASRKATAQHVPSAGFDDDAELCKNSDPIQDPIVEQEQQPRGTKRKKRTVDKEQRDVFPAQLDFFGTGSKDKVPSKVSDSVLRDISYTRHTKNDLGGGNITPALSEEECRRTLKRHKIKVTLLEVPHEARERTELIEKNTETQGTVQKRDTRTQLSVQPLTSFNQLRSRYGISSRLANNLALQGYKTPTEVQVGSLPILLGSDEDCGLGAPAKSTRKGNQKHRSNTDLLTIAPTGSGKTLAFMVPAINGLLEHGRTRRRDAVQTLIIAPTHELADQIVNEGRKLAMGTGIKISAMRKGMNVNTGLQDYDGHQNGDVAAGAPNGGHEKTANAEHLVKADILISTPLILLHAISSPSKSLLSVRNLILDEADILLDPLFREQTLGIWGACTNPDLRTSLWSATIGSSIESLAQSYILDRQRNLSLLGEIESPPHHIIRLVVGLKDSAVPNISHKLVYAASEQGKLLALRQLLHPSSTAASNTFLLRPPFLIFTQTIPRAVALHSELLYDIPPEAGGSSRIAVLHSDLSDIARSNIMAGFRRGEIWILITTDLLSRGVDFRGMNGVVNYDIPNTGALYVHRAGRTGRQGREGGVAVTLYTKEDIPYVKNVANVIAASEKVKGKCASAIDGQEGLQKWLLDALPKLDKKTKQELKRKGIECRRAKAGNDRDARKMRISTKSGYDRRLENRRKGAMIGSQRREEKEALDVNESTDSKEWGGIDG